ncbi:MAG TPA: type II toxin-antitoxin system Phd/YefM family antitoxin [Vicinamibacterales bacterium]|nr:type II toxin-antitoxin system Phd/YefM family antitoxin [Vicinamibacterales bacterium]
MGRTRHRPATTLPSRDFNQDTGRAKHAARRGPVIITDRGRPAHVLLTYEDYQQLIAAEGNIIDLLGHPAGVADVDLESPRLRDPGQPADLA